jgi:hypothetical protein
MKQILFSSLLLLMVIGCQREFEPELKGWQASTVPGRRLYLNIDGRQTTVVLPGDEGISYRYPQWTKFQDHLLLTQITKTKRCYDFQIISIDTTGAIIDTVYTPPPNTPINFKLAPNDSLLILKTYDDNCEDDSDHFRYTFYNRHTKKKLSDTITVGNARGIPLIETVWSPNSKRVIISQWASGRTKAFTYDLVTKDTTRIDAGSNFVWSPIDNNLVAYIKDYSIYTKNIETGEKELIFKGRGKKGATDFRWNPTGAFLMIHIQGYLLNVERAPLQTHNIIYLSMTDKSKSRVFYDDQRIHTWKNGSATGTLQAPVAHDSLK